MKYVKIIILIIVASSLLLNFFLFSKITTIENSLENISLSQMDIMSNVSEQTSNVTNIIEDFKQEQSWISTVQWEIQDQNVKNGKANLYFKWQVKELVPNSLVAIHYKYGDKQEYQSVTAKTPGDGLFEASVPIEVNVEPEWSVNTIISNNNQTMVEESVRGYEEYSKEEIDKNDFSYYITVSNEDVIKSSEIDTVHLGELAMRYYGYLETSVYLEGDDFSVSVTQYKNESDIFLEEAYLIKYKNNTKVEEEKLDTSNYNDEDPYGPEREHSIHFPSKDGEFNSLLLKVIYSNGTSFEKEVYRE
ncbi:hypothetical protein [Fredinandcohnia sp. 179-A 10B2 NHS]|uniref:hypothetical protein n=1 Tax=Fredinandcohnia sp. 179-A 10B2 NHS TaxID=3235176 RepID=UPI0039A3BD1A